MYDSALFSNLSLPQNERTLIKDDIKKKEGGFTIVEVMIVLAIAGLILAIVFIAVPALQRNSRNTGRRADLGNLRAQVETWVSNNGGKLPDDADVGDFASIIGSTGWGHYNGNDDEPSVITFAVTTAGVPPATPATGSIQLNSGAVAYAAGDIGEYKIYYGRDPEASTAGLGSVALPGRQEIHVWGEMACGGEILTGGNDRDVTGTDVKYVFGATDVALVKSNARAIAYVYQIEGEDNARCEDNV